MRASSSVQVTALLLVVTCGCRATTSSTGPSLELVDQTQRIDAGLVNAHVYGSFVIPFAGGPQVILSGPANFPGNPPGGPGTCVNGLWYNSKGKATAGTLTNPHPHCVSSGSAATVVLEPISVAVRDPRRACEFGAPCDFIHFTTPDKVLTLSVVQAFSSPKGGILGTQGFGTVVAYAIDASTLNGANTRVGTITLDLNQYDDPTTDLFGTCSLTDEEFACLPLVIIATYQPLTVGGVGTPLTIHGFLWWAMASAPYNY